MFFLNIIMKTIHIVPIDEASKPKTGKAFLLPGSYSPYTIGHHEMARQAAAHAASTGHTHFYHGIGAASKQSADDPLTHGQKRSAIRSGHRDIAKEHKGMQFHTTEKEHVSPFHQVAHLARQGHKHITIGLGSDQMKEGGVKTAIERHVKKYGGILDKDGKVHKATVSFHQMGAERHEGDMPRHEVLARLRKGDMSVAKAGRLRKAVASGDTELAHELMPKHINKPKYFNLIKKQQARVAKPKKKALVKEGYMSFLDFIREAPELDPYIEPSELVYPDKYDKHFRDRKKQHVYDRKNDRYVGHRNLGEIHPGYELHRHRMARRGIGRGEDPVVHFHRYTIVHKKSKDVAGEIDATAGKINRKTGEHRPGTGKGLKIEWLGVHSDHSSKKAGKSLAVAAYKHLHSKGHSIKSDVRQSYGGAHVWDKMRHDPDVKDHVKFHDQLDNKATPAHELSHGRIWKQDQSGQESTLVLHAKPKKKAVVSEDIELIPVHRDTHVDKRKAADVHKAYGSKTYSSDKVVKRKNLGQIHPGYDLHQHSVEINTGRGDERAVKHKFTIVHRASGDIAGEMHAWGGKLHPVKGVIRGTKGKGLKVSHLEVHPDHREKKIGTSLPVEMYRHLHRRGHAIQSDANQSHGAANVWNTMRHDRELRKHMMIHDSGGAKNSRGNAFEPRAHKRPESHIWYQHSRSWSHDRGQKVEPSFGDEPETVKTLILSGKKRKKTVKEDIEIANVLEKPSSGLLSPRNFAKTVERTGNPTKRSGRIAKGYTLHTSTHKDDPKVQTHYIVHDQTGHVAGEVSTVSHGDEHQVIHTEVHGAHTRKKIGKSLAALAYKHIAKKKGNLWSSGLQSPGGASVWNRLRKDPKMKGRVFHHTRAGEVPAHDVPEKRIWASDTLEDEPKVTKSKGTPSFLPTTGESDPEHRRVLGSRLVIRPLRKS